MTTIGSGIQTTDVSGTEKYLTRNNSAVICVSKSGKPVLANIYAEKSSLIEMPQLFKNFWKSFKIQ